MVAKRAVMAVERPRETRTRPERARGEGATEASTSAPAREGGGSRRASSPETERAWVRAVTRYGVEEEGDPSEKP